MKIKTFMSVNFKYQLKEILLGISIKIYSTLILSKRRICFIGSNCSCSISKHTDDFSKLYVIKVFVHDRKNVL